MSDVIAQATGHSFSYIATAYRRLYNPTMADDPADPMNDSSFLFVEGHGVSGCRPGDRVRVTMEKVWDDTAQPLCSYVAEVEARPYNATMVDDNSDPMNDSWYLWVPGHAVSGCRDGDTVRVTMEKLS